jgi:hypothetical protein
LSAAADDVDTFWVLTNAPQHNYVKVGLLGRLSRRDEWAFVMDRQKFLAYNFEPLEE